MQDSLISVLVLNFSFNSAWFELILCNLFSQFCQRFVNKSVRKIKKKTFINTFLYGGSLHCPSALYN